MCNFLTKAPDGLEYCIIKSDKGEYGGGGWIRACDGDKCMINRFNSLLYEIKTKLVKLELVVDAMQKE